MARLRQIPLNANTGAFVAILATGSCTGFEFMEDEASATQGLQVKTLEDNFATINTLSFGSEPGTVPNFHKYGIRGQLLGLPAQGDSGAFNYREADTLLIARSASATPTVLRFIEYE